MDIFKVFCVQRISVHTVGPQFNISHKFPPMMSGKAANTFNSVALIFDWHLDVHCAAALSAVLCSG